MKPKIPKAIQHGHESLCSELEDVIEQGGKVGEKAKSLKDTMEFHFKKEEEYALPPLGLLMALSEGSWEINAKEAIKMADSLQADWCEMAKEHSDIAKVMHELKQIAEEEDNSIAKHFVKSLTLHMELEDQVLYPATILIGNYLKNISKG